MARPNPVPNSPPQNQRQCTVTMELGKSRFVMTGSICDVQTFLDLWLAHLPAGDAHTQAVLNQQTETLNTASGRLETALSTKGQ